MSRALITTYSLFALRNRKGLTEALKSNHLVKGNGDLKEASKPSCKLGGIAGFSAIAVVDDVLAWSVLLYL